MKPALLSLLVCLPALAQDNPLAGPTVDGSAPRASIVERDFAGVLKRLETTPEEAALKLIKLDGEAAKATAQVLADRAALLDKVVADNLELLVQLQTAREGGDRAEATKILADLGRALAPVQERGTLTEQLASAMPMAEATQFRALVEEYWQAVEDEAAAAAEKAGQSPRRRMILNRERLLGLGQEIRRAYDRQVGQRSKDLDATLAKLSLTPEQEGKIRKLIGDSFAETKGKPTPEQNRALFARILTELTPDQKRALLKETASRRWIAQEPRGGAKNRRRMKAPVLFDRSTGSLVPTRG